MAAAKQKIEWPVNATAASSGGSDRAGAHAPSPARALQRLLDQRTAPVEEVERWSRRRQIAFIAVSATALWAAILEIASQAVRAIA